VVADSTKVGREHLISFAPLDSIDVLITDEEISPTDTSEFHDHGIEVVIA
ncbi:D-beta-D-heptose 1-phosphate adenosyltransferase, partial [Rhodococcus erythropolis]|nr:D-beta-D-heptose 1-phosphate adenosyltransferase [Rhodococcus erythropolis]